MARCDACGNDYDKAFEVSKDGRRYTFDSLECAAHVIAPRCEQCGLQILGHGVEEQGSIYCCASCARVHGKDQLRDRGDAQIEVPSRL